MSLSLIELARAIGALLLAPLVYFFTGLPWAIATRRLIWAPLWGVGVFGIVAELASISGCPVPTAAVVVGGLHVVVGACFIWRQSDLSKALRSEVQCYAKMYAIALSPILAAPFALPGSWGGDWEVSLKSGEHILNATRFSSELLARPPLFGAAAIPTLLLAPGMLGFQVFCAVASACTLQAFRSGLKPDVRSGLVWVLAGSVFFLQITANAWPKFLCAAFTLAAWLALDGKKGGHIVTAGALIGLAIATHQSAILFLPLLITRFLQPGNRWTALFGQTAIFLFFAAAMAAPWEIHTILTYGLNAKIDSNPSVAQRIATLPKWENALLVGVTTFVAWSPLGVFRHWLASPDRFSLMRVGHEIYWLATSYFNSMAGSILGLVLPWSLALGLRAFGMRLVELWRTLSLPVVAAYAVALAGQMLLNPFYSTDGTLQTGWVPVGLGLALWFATDLSKAPAPLLRDVLDRTLWLAAGPWFLFNTVLTAALVLSRRFRDVFVDTDLDMLKQHGWVTLAMGGFPWVQSLFVASIVLARQMSFFDTGPRPRQTHSE